MDMGANGSSVRGCTNHQKALQVQQEVKAMYKRSLYRQPQAAVDLQQNITLSWKRRMQLFKFLHLHFKLSFDLQATGQRLLMFFYPSPPATLPMTLGAHSS